MGVALTLGIMSTPGLLPTAYAKTASSEPERVGVVDAAIESLTGDVYAEPSRWQPLSLGTFFTEGWDQAWASPPPGAGGAPRQGWIGAQDGVFYRLWIATYGFAREFGENGNQHTGTFQLYTPFSRRFELRYDLPMIVSNKGATDDYHTAAGDLAVGRIQLAEAVGLPLTASIVPVRSALRPAPADGDALVREALTKHPQLLQANLDLQLAENARHTARAAFLPTVGVQGGWEFNGETLGAQQSAWVIGAEVRVNLFRELLDLPRHVGRCGPARRKS